MLILSFISINLYSGEIKSKLITSAIGNNEQIIHNLDNSLIMLEKLSEYPIYDDKLVEILKKDYSAIPNYKHVKSTDLEKAKDLLNTNIVFYSNLIESVWLYGIKDFDLRGRALVETMDSDYKITDEVWLKRIIDKDGASTIIGIHQDKQKMPGTNFVITIGRLIKNKNTREKIGIILMCAGTVSDLIDRVGLGFSIGFFDFEIWPIFNNADLSAFAGMIILICFVLFGREHKAA
jgi:hypothetical protein